jgi:hypothetical protein
MVKIIAGQVTATEDRVLSRKEASLRYLLTHEVNH